MLTEVEADRKAFEEQERMRQCVRDFAKVKARRDVRKLKPEFLDSAAQERFERLLAVCEKDADQIACEAGEEATAEASRTEFSVAAYEVAYIEAYSEALPMLMATAPAHRAAAET
jgi:vacuolar-type H+-ATPase subunit E/Vma4